MGGGNQVTMLVIGGGVEVICRGYVMEVADRQTTRLVSDSTRAMGAEVAAQRGVGTIVLDVRRGDGPARCFNYTMASVAATDSRLAAVPALASRIIRAIASTHAALRADLALATKVGRKLFPPQEADLIAALIARDLPYYDTAISETFVSGMNAFARDMGILRGEVPYAEIVVPQMRASPAI